MFLVFKSFLDLVLFAIRGESKKHFANDQKKIVAKLSILFRCLPLLCAKQRIISSAVFLNIFSKELFYLEHIKFQEQKVGLGL